MNFIPRSNAATSINLIFSLALAVQACTTRGSAERFPGPGGRLYVRDEDDEDGRARRSKTTAADAGKAPVKTATQATRMRLRTPTAARTQARPQRAAVNSAPLLRSSDKQTKCKTETRRLALRGADSPYHAIGRPPDHQDERSRAIGVPFTNTATNAAQDPT